MGLDYSNFGTVTNSDNGRYDDFSNLSRLQSQQSLGYGDQAAKYADPFMAERPKYQKRLSDLIENPGSQESSPFFKYLMETEMNQVNASNAAGGFRNSGRGLMALQDRAAGVASQAYFPQVNALSNLAMSGSSPDAAGKAYAYGTERSQNYAQLAAAARALSDRPKQPASGTSSGPVFGSKAWQDMMYGKSYEDQAFDLARSGGGGGSSTGLPSGGYYQSPSSMSLAQLQAESYPSSSGYGAGTGYVTTSDGGTTNFNNGVGAYDPYAAVLQNNTFSPFESGGYTGEGFSGGYDPFSSQPSVYDAGFQYDPYSAVGLTAPEGYQYDPYASSTGTDWGGDWGNDWEWE